MTDLQELRALLERGGFLGPRTGAALLDRLEQAEAGRANAESKLALCDSDLQQMQVRNALLERVAEAAQDFIACWRGDPPIEGSPHDYIKPIITALDALPPKAQP
jgi:hypothetical protein